MSKKAPITVTLKKGKHATQPWTFEIDDTGPGPKVTVKERYARKDSAKRGAERKLKMQFYACDTSPCTCGWKTPDGREVVFVTKTSKK